MRKVVRRTVTLIIKETWTIVWPGGSEPVETSCAAAQGASLAQLDLPDLAPPEPAGPQTALPVNESATTLPEGVPTAGVPGAAVKQPDPLDSGQPAIGQGKEESKQGAKKRK